MKKTEPEQVSIPIAEYKDLLSHSAMLGRMSVSLEPFCQTEEDTTYLALKRLLAQYYELKADEAWKYFEQEEERCAS